MSHRVPKLFTGLHSHSGFSVFDGLGYPKEHIDFVIENGMNSWALTDHGHMNGFAHAHQYVKELNKNGQGFKFIPGCEMYVHPDLNQWRREAATVKEEKEAAKAAKKSKSSEDDEGDGGITIENEDETKSSKHYNPLFRRHHLVVLPKNSRGLEKLFGLVSRGYKDGFYKFPRVDYGMIKEVAGGDLIGSTACIGGPLAYDVLSEFRHVPFDQLEPHLLDQPGMMDKVLRKIENTSDQIIDAFGAENFFVEIQFNKLASQHLVNRALIEMARRRGLKLVATADSHYARPDYWKEREIYKKLGWLNYTSYDPSLLPQSTDDLKAELYPKNAQQMWDAYKATGAKYSFYNDEEVCNAIEMSHHIAHELIEDVQPDTKVKLPSYVVPAGKTPMQALVDKCKEGLKRLNLSYKPEYIERLKTELQVIKEKDFAQYFLTMEKIINIAKENMLVGCGRGSSAGSLVNYCLGITDVDPLKYDLLFERFISRQRVEYPDIDTDFADRAGLIPLLREQFGDQNVIPISNYNTFKLKSLIKDLGRFYGIPFEEVNNATKDVDEDVRSKVLKTGDDKNLFELKYDDAVEHHEPFREFMEKYPELSRHLKVLLHQNRSLGRHAGGVVISEKIAERMPLITSGGELQTPWVEGMHYKHLEHYGWLKFDLLGLETLRIIQRAIELILKRHHGVGNPTFKDVKKWYEENLHPSVLNLEDEKVFKHVYHDARWAGIFQVTEKGAQRFFESAKPNSITDIAALTSIYRPGPLAAKVDQIYVKAKENPDKVVYEHALVEKALKKTNGAIIFQEQIMALGNIVGGFTLDETDKMRKVITKRSMSGKDKAAQETEKLKQKFIDGAVKNGLDRDVADKLFEKIKFFSGYGFNASHAISYAIDSYQCAWLLTYFEAEWLCAYLESMSGNPDDRAKAIGEIKGFGYEVVGIDINYADKGWTILDGKKFMPSFLSVKGMGAAAIEEVLANRPYKNFEDLLYNEDGTWKHSKFNRKSMENLLKLEAMTSIGVGEGKLFKNHRQAHHVLIENQELLKTKGGKNRKTGEIRLTGIENFRQLATSSSVQSMEDWSRIEKIQGFKEILGSVEMDILVPKKIRDRLDEKNVKSIDSYTEKGLYWFIADEATPKKTRNGKEYMLLRVIGETGKMHKIFCWAWSAKNQPPGLCDVYLAELDKSNFGFSTSSFKMRRFSL